MDINTYIYMYVIYSFVYMTHTKEQKRKTVVTKMQLRFLKPKEDIGRLHFKTEIERRSRVKL